MKNQKGFSLVQLLAVLAAVGCLVGIVYAASTDLSGGGTTGVPAYQGKRFTLEKTVSFTAAAPGVLNDQWTVFNIPAKTLLLGLYVEGTNSYGTGTVMHAYTFSVGDRVGTSNLVSGATVADYARGQVVSNLVTGYRYYETTNAIIVIPTSGVVPSNATLKVKAIGEYFGD